MRHQDLKHIAKRDEKSMERDSYSGVYMYTLCDDVVDIWIWNPILRIYLYGLHISVKSVTYCLNHDMYAYLSGSV